MRGCAMYELVRVGHDELVGGEYMFPPPHDNADDDQRSFGLRRIELLSKFTRRLRVLQLETQS